MIMRVIRQTEVYLSEFRSQLASDLEEYETGRRTTMCCATDCVMNIRRTGLRC
jgi:hypothetical protein